MKTTGLLAVLTLALFSAEAQDTTVAVNPDRDIPIVQDLVAPGNAVSSAEPSQSSLPWQRLEARGISPHIAMIVDWSKNFRGGACSRGSVPRQLFKSSLTVVSDKSLGWKGGTGYASLYYHTGRNGGDDTGDAQGFSNIDAPPRTYLYELWFQQELLRGKLRLKAGKVDSNTEFAVVENGADFLNSSMGYSPTILGFATYPQPRPSVNVFYQASKHIFAKAGLYDVPGAGAMPVAEGGRTWAVTSRELEGRLSAGLWRQTGKMECFDGDEEAGTGGFYLIAEQMVWRGEPAPSSGGAPHAEETSQPNVAVFWQYGAANGDVSRFTKHVGGGVVWRGPFARRLGDVLGFGATWVVLHNEPETALNRPSELTLEGFYKIRITRFLNLVPDVQFIHLPGGLSSQRDCLVATPRLTITF